MTFTIYSKLGVGNEEADLIQLEYRDFDEILPDFVNTSGADGTEIDDSLCLSKVGTSYKIKLDGKLLESEETWIQFNSETRTFSVDPSQINVGSSHEYLIEVLA